MPQKTKSVVLVTVDCLRADHVGFMGYGRATTPFLDRLSAESFVFPCAIVSGAPTYYSLPGILASRHPLAHGRDTLGLAPQEPNLASAFQQAGYATAFFGAGNPYISPTFGYDFGFEVFQDFLDANSLSSASQNVVPANRWIGTVNRGLQRVASRIRPIGAAYNELYFRYCQRRTRAPESFDMLRRFPSADVIVDRASNWLSSVGDSPFFLWLHLMDPHSPYYPTKDALKLMNHGAITPSRAAFLNASWNRSDLDARRLGRHRLGVMALYDAGIRWVDAQMERLVDVLRLLGVWDRCMFALTADHGEEFLDHDGRYHPPSQLHEEVAHVPLMLRAPDVAKVRLPNSPFSMIHLSPTLLDFAGLDSPSTFRGRSRKSEMQGGILGDEVTITESVGTCTNPLSVRGRVGSRILAVRESRYKLILDFANSSERVYDLEADPAERQPLPADEQKAVRRRLFVHAREHLHASRNLRDSKIRMRSQLRDLRHRFGTPDRDQLPDNSEASIDRNASGLQLQFPESRAS